MAKASTKKRSNQANHETTTLAAELEALRLPELQARFREVIGEITRSPNRTFLIRRITEALAAKAVIEPESTVAHTTEAEPVVEQSIASTATTIEVEQQAAMIVPVRRTAFRERSQA